MESLITILANLTYLFQGIFVELPSSRKLEKPFVEVLQILEDSIHNQGRL
jgi:hypothetical protein